MGQESASTNGAPVIPHNSGSYNWKIKREVTVRFPPVLLMLSVVVISILPPSGAQISNRRTEPPYTAVPQNPEDEQRAKIIKDMEKRRNEDRQKQLKRDTERLVQLANELKEYVDKSNENILSMDVVKKAEEIEKYAHSVKEKMKTAQ